MKYCTKCGTMLNDDDLFCSKCGNKVSPPIQVTNDNTKVEDNKEIVEAKEPIKEEIKEENAQPVSNEEPKIEEAKTEIIEEKPKNASVSSLASLLGINTNKEQKTEPKKVEETNNSSKEEIVVEDKPTNKVAKENNIKETIVEEKEEIVLEENTTNEITEENNTKKTDIEEHKEIQANNGKKTKKRVSIHEETIKQFLPVPLVLIGCTIIFWIIDKCAPLNPTAITRIFPLLLFMFISIFYSVMSMIRAIKTLNRKLYLKSALAFVLFGLLVTCALIDFIFLVNS